MPELRKDPIVGRWIVIDTENQKSPGDFPKEDNAPKARATCQFCPGKEHFTPAEVDGLRPAAGQANAEGWLVRTVPNKFPALTRQGRVDKEAWGMFDIMSGVGAHEVVIETPDHSKQLADLSVDEVACVIKQYVSRSRALAEDERHQYVCIFKNFGHSAGATVEHAHSQIIALPMVPKAVLEEIRGAQHYYDQHGRCVFCDVIEQEYKDRERIIHENNSFLTFVPFAPRYAFETWIIPKSHGASFNDLDGDLHDFAASLRDALIRIKKALGNPAYNFYLHTAPIHYAWPQQYHWHIEIIPKLTRSIGFEWGTGLHIVPTYPQNAAQYLRNAAA